MKKLTLFAAAVALLLCGAARAASPVRVEFDTDMSAIRQNEALKLQKVADTMIQNGIKIVLIGHADDRASRVYNLDLAMRRAEAVEKALRSLGVPAELISATASSGKERSIAPDDKLPEHRQTNRCVEVILSEFVYAVETQVETVTEVPAYNKNRVSLLGGMGRTGLDKNTIGPNHFVVDQDYSAVFGLGYSRSLSRRWSVGFTAFTNNSYFANIGFDF